MCGIFFSVADDQPLLPDDQTAACLKARGPDSYRARSLTVADGAGQPRHVTFVASVLALRGDGVQEQPLVDPASGSVFCWNGEAWKTQGVAIAGNDSARIWTLLLEAAATASHDAPQRVCQTLSTITGPFAFVFYHGPTSTVYYGRDRLGRRSLLIEHQLEHEHSAGRSRTLCSVNVPAAGRFVEVETDAIHYFSLQRAAKVSEKLSWPGIPPPVNKDSPHDELPSMPSSSSVRHFLAHLRSAIELRVVDIPDLTHSLTASGSAKVAILFSGGLDCTLLARLVHDVLPTTEPVDLLNVAFENPRAMAAQATATTEPYELCPDRITGHSGFAELLRVCPQREWRFVAINVPYTESLGHRSTIIRLMSPHNTEMDLSIAMALYFAARGAGHALRGPALSSPGETYTTPARVLLSGLGADELFGGYSRHAAAFARGGYGDLAAELEMDLNRIGRRNLGRDDRVISHWGKEVRYPYLDEDFVQFARRIPVWERTGFRMDQKIPPSHQDAVRASTPSDLEPAKLLLRLAMWAMGMETTASERKRAIQFGARTAKMDPTQGRTKGTDLVLPDS